MKPVNNIEGVKASLAALDEGADLKLYLSWLQNRNVTRFLEVRHQTYDHARLLHYIAAENARPDAVLFGIYANPDHSFIGTLRLSEIRPVLRLCVLSLMIGNNAYWGRGVASEVIDLASRYAFDVLRIHKVMAGCYMPNVASYKAFIKASFVLEGRSEKERFFEGHWVDILMLGRLNPADNIANGTQESDDDAR